MNIAKKTGLLIALLCGGILTSCNKPTTEPQKPTISVNPTTVSADKGTSVAIVVTAGSNANLKTMTVTSSVNGSSAGTIFDTTFSNKTNVQFTYSYPISASAAAGDKIVLTFTINDNNSTSNSATSTITVMNPPKGCSGVVLGAQNNSAAGSFFSSQNCGIFFVNESVNNKAKIDFIYFYGTTNAATLAAPDDADVNTFGVYNLNSWTAAEKNQTRFKKLSSSDLDYSTSDAAKLQAGFVSATSAESSKANMLKVGDLYGFRTQAGKFGAFKVTAISGTDAGTITIDVKTQQ